MKQLIEQIDRLSIRDTKTLSQKGLKAAEEVGELARAILPYEGAHGTNHRVPNGDKIIEECADTILVAYSIMKTMGCDLDRVVQELQRKTNYWQFLIDNEDKADMDNLAFEIHITVKADMDMLEPFKETCAELKVKPILLDLYGDSASIKDLMTSSVFTGTTKQVIDHTKKLAAELRLRGFEVLREKIETVPWHPAAQIKLPRQSAYFEAHFAFDTPYPELLKQFCKEHSIHLSRNRMKTSTSSVMMGTYRVDAQLTTPGQFEADVNNILFLADANGHPVTKKPYTEYSLFDTNEQHDGKWIAGAL